jgi:hypothetical protein
MIRTVVDIYQLFKKGVVCQEKRVPSCFFILDGLSKSDQNRAEISKKFLFISPNQDEGKSNQSIYGEGAYISFDDFFAS